MSAPAIISSGTAAGGPPVGGTGTTNTIPRWTGPSTLGDSVLVQVGAGIGLGTSTLYTGTKLQVSGSGGVAAITSEDTNAGGNFLRWLADTTNQPLINWTTGSALRFATSTSAFGTFAEWMRITAAGRLLVGTSTAPPAGGSSIRMVIADPTGNSCGQEWNNNAGGGAVIPTGPNLMYFYGVNGAPGAETYTLGMVHDASNKYLSLTQSGWGLKLPATPGNTDPNTLDAYVDGGTAGSGGATFTATLKGLVSDPTTPVTTTGKYILVGKLLVMTIVFSNVNTTGAAGAIYVQTNLAAALRPERNCVGAVTLDSIATITGVGTHVIANTGGDIYVAQNTSNAAVSFCTHNAGAARGLTLTVSYMIP